MKPILPLCRELLHKAVARFWEQSESIKLTAAIASVVLGLVAVIGVLNTAKSVRLQYQLYEEETFNREAGAVALAWRALSDANSRPIEMGQSSAFKYLTSKGLMNGNVSLTGSRLSIHQQSADHPITIALNRSNLCGSEFILTAGPESIITFQHSLLISSRLTGRMIGVDFTAANLERSEFYLVRARNGVFIAADLNKAELRGGSFERADFQGANLTGLQTYRGYSGAGTKYADDIYGSGNLYSGYPETDSLPPAYFTSPTDDISNLLGNYDTGDANIYLVDLRGARFRNALIKGADLSNSTINQAQVDEACADSTTKLPNGITVKTICSEANWITERRNRLQQKTYYARTKDLEICKAAANEPVWK